MTVSKNYLGRSSKERGDLDLMKDDLIHVKECASGLLKIFDDPIKMSSIGHVETALLDSALIRYRRCFNRSIRISLNTDFTKEDGDVKEAHNYFLDIADKHVARSVNSFENAGVSVLFSKRESDSIYIPDKVSVSKFKTLMISSAEICLLDYLADYFIDVISKKIKLLDASIIENTSTMEEFEVESLKKRMPTSEDYIKRQKHGKQRLV